jgi:hypothetical protein
VPKCRRASKCARSFPDSCVGALSKMARHSAFCMKLRPLAISAAAAALAAMSATASLSLPITCDHVLTLTASKSAERCVANERGWIIGPEAEVDAAAAALAEAASRFDAIFNRPAPRLLFRLGDDEDDRFVGFAIERGISIIVWPSAIQTRALVRAALAEQLAPLRVGKSPEALAELDALVARFDEQQPSAPTPVEVGTYQHEIGHALFASVYFPKSLASGGYGTPAPDWLDEAAAIGLENSELGALRRAGFTSKSSPVCTPVRSLFSLQHPHRPNGRGGRVTVRVSVGTPRSDSAKSEDDIGAFYARVRGLLDFLATLPPEYFSTMADKVSSGLAIEEALPVARERAGLGPLSLNELQREYSAWLVARSYCTTREALTNPTHSGGIR